MATETQIKQDVHHYLESGLDNVWIEGGFTKVTGPDGEESISITDLDGLHRCIAKILLQKTSSLTGAEFRFLRTELDLSQTTMASLCGRQERTVRDWEAGESVEEPANTIIRFVYEQRFNPSAKFEDMSKQIKQIQELDKQLHELKLKSTQHGWKPSCELKKAA
jgi:putative transcriptional regulator